MHLRSHCRASGNSKAHVAKLCQVEKSTQTYLLAAISTCDNLLYVCAMHADNKISII